MSRAGTLMVALVIKLFAWVVLRHAVIIVLRRSGVHRLCLPTCSVQNSGSFDETLRYTDCPINLIPDLRLQFQTLEVLIDRHLSLHSLSKALRNFLTVLLGPFLRLRIQIYR